MFSIIVSDFEPVRNYIKNTLKKHIGVNNSMVISNIKEISNDKIDSLIREFGQLSIFFDLDEKPRLLNVKSKLKIKNAFDLMDSIDRKSSVSFFVVGSEMSLLENIHKIINHNIQSHQMLTKPFNGLQLTQFINTNLTNHFPYNDNTKRISIAA